MTESDWATSTDVTAMLAFLRDRGASDRKLRLFAVACCRGTGPPVHQHDLGRGEVERLWRAIRVAEQFADGSPQVTAADLEMAYITADFRFEDAGALAWAYHATANPSAWAAAFDVVRCLDDACWDEGEANYGTACLKDIFGNPFHTAAFDPSWRTVTVVALARHQYEARDFSAMPVMADALEDAGCTSEVMLSHCRGDGPHVRGCWVVDAVLGKS